MNDPVIDRYEAGGGMLAYAISGLSPEQVTARPGPGDWSIAELVGHLLDADLVYAERMKRVLAEESPVLQNFDENAWVARFGAGEIPLEEAAELFRSNRRWMARILRSCSESDFARTGRHTERGPLTLAELVATMVGHLDHHLRFLYGKRANLGVALPPRYTFT
jgi:uncharacterized damage-inducible protein DinB